MRVSDLLITAAVVLSHPGVLRGLAFIWQYAARRVTRAQRQTLE